MNALSWRIDLHFNGQLKSSKSHGKWLELQTTMYKITSNETVPGVQGGWQSNTFAHSQEDKLDVDRLVADSLLCRLPVEMPYILLRHH